MVLAGFYWYNNFSAGLYSNNVTVTNNTVRFIELYHGIYGQYCTINLNNVTVTNNTVKLIGLGCVIWSMYSTVIH